MLCSAASIVDKLRGSLMGGTYPTSRGFHGTFTKDLGSTFRPGGIPVIPRNRPGFFTPNPGSVTPSTFDPGSWSGMPDDPWDIPTGKQPYVRKGKFPSPWTPTKSPFGKKQPWDFYPSFPTPPTRWGKFLPPAAAIIGVAAYWFQRPPDYDKWLTDQGYHKCCSLSGPREAFSHNPNYNLFPMHCDFTICGIGGQVAGGNWPPVAPLVDGADPEIGDRLLIGAWESIELNRYLVLEEWRRPSRIGGYDPHQDPPFPIYVPWVIWPRPVDPNAEVPLVAYSPPTYPRPVWGHDPSRPSSPSFPPKTTGGNSYPPSTVITSPPRKPDNPYVSVRYPGDPHRPVKPDPWKEKESKWTISKKGPFAALAVGLLWAGSKVYNGITETVDLVSAIYAALPDEIIASHVDNLTDSEKLPFMLGMIYQHMDKIDMNEALTNIAANAIEDAVWGRYFKTLNKVRRHSGADVEGFDRQLGELNQLFRELYA